MSRLTTTVHRVVVPPEPVTDFQTFETSSGPVRVPMLLKETVCTRAFFCVAIRKIRNFLPSSKLKPVVIGRGKTIYAIAAYEYLDTSIGPYSEVAMGVACIYDPRVNIPFLPAIFDQAFSVGFYLCHLPVTSKIALDSARKHRSESSLFFLRSPGSSLGRMNRGGLESCAI